MELSHVSVLPLLAVVVGRPGTLELLPGDAGLGLPGTLELLPGDVGPGLPGVHSGLPPPMVRELLLHLVSVSLLGPGEQSGVDARRDVETKFSL